MRSGPSFGSALCVAAAVALVAAAGVAVEDAQDLAGSALGADRVRHHRGELGGLVGLDAQAAVAEHEDRSAGQDDEPFAPRVGTHARRVPGRWFGHALAHHAHAGVTLDEPAHPAVGAVDHRAGHDIVSGGLHELIQRGVQGAGESDQLIQGETALAVLDAAQ